VQIKCAARVEPVRRSASATSRSSAFPRFSKSLDCDVGDLFQRYLRFSLHIDTSLTFAAHINEAIKRLKSNGQFWRTNLHVTSKLQDVFNFHFCVTHLRYCNLVLCCFKINTSRYQMFECY
jgi:hypothetical protein